MIKEVLWKNITCALRLSNHVYKEKENFKHMDSLLDCEIDSFINHLWEDSDIDFKED